MAAPQKLRPSGGPKLVQPRTQFLLVESRKHPSIRVEQSAGNVLIDLGFPDAVELDLKLRLAVAINLQLQSRRLNQAAAAIALSINQPKVSALKHYKLDGFSVERLMIFLTALGSDIEIRIRPPASARRAGRIVVETV
jgi:predicted XRE-type DNA-binding protein